MKIFSKVMLVRQELWFSSITMGLKPGGKRVVAAKGWTSAYVPQYVSCKDLHSQGDFNRMNIEELVIKLCMEVAICKEQV